MNVEFDRGNEGSSEMPCGTPQRRGGSHQEPCGGESDNVQMSDESEGGCSRESRGDMIHEIDLGNLEETTADSETTGGLRQLACASDNYIARI